MRIIKKAPVVVVVCVDIALFSGLFFGFTSAFIRLLFYNPYAAKIIETYCTGLRANCSGVKIYYNP